MNKASLMIDIEGPSLSSDDIELIKSPYVGGLILFDRNFIKVFGEVLNILKNTSDIFSVFFSRTRRKISSKN